jgi:hypothetical protein
MTTVIASFIAVVLFGMIMIATISYGDTLGMMSAPDSVALAQRLQTAASLSSQVQATKGSRPRSAAELIAEGMPVSAINGLGDLEVSCSDEACTTQAICMVIPNSSNNLVAAKAAASRVKGEVSGKCGDGDTGIGDSIVVTMWI